MNVSLFAEVADGSSNVPEEWKLLELCLKLLPLFYFSIVCLCYFNFAKIKD
jgi:hypothetical protein